MFDIYFDLSNMHQVVVEEETFVDMEIEGESISFNFELDLPEGMLPDDDYPVIVKDSGKCATNSKKKYLNGATCVSCNEIYPYADEPNQKDGSFKCYSCRKYG